jgi:hypothetical protein
MDANETVLELRRLELEIMEHERALEDLRRQSREVLEVLASRPNRRSVLDRAGRQRFLQGCGSAKRSQPT